MIKQGLERLRLSWLAIVQSSLAAGAAWWAATEVIGHERPFFAPIAAVISIGVSMTSRLRRAAELVAGVAVGVLAGDLLIALIGTGTPQLILIIALAMTIAVFISGRDLVVLQSAISGVLVATLLPIPGEISGLDRFVDALVGGALGIGVTALLLPVNPVIVTRRHANRVFDELAETLQDVATAIKSRELAAGIAALNRARGMEEPVRVFRSALEESAEVSRIAPARWRTRTQIGKYVDAAQHVDHATRNTRVLARRVVASLRSQDQLPAAVPEALRRLARAVRELAAAFSRDSEPERFRELAVEAAGLATEALATAQTLSAQVVIAQVRSMTLDLLRASGLTREGAQRLLP